MRTLSQISIKYLTHIILNSRKLNQGKKLYAAQVVPNSIFVPHNDAPIQR